MLKLGLVRSQKPERAGCDCPVSLELASWEMCVSRQFATFNKLSKLFCPIAKKKCCSPDLALIRHVHVA